MMGCLFLVMLLIASFGFGVFVPTWVWWIAVAAAVLSAE